MKIFIVGATGGTGQHLVHQALAQGHEVTALARHRAEIKLAHDRLRVVEGDVLNPASLDAVIGGHDAVLSTLGSQKATEKTTLLSEGTRNVIGAMNKHGIRRFVCITVLGAGDSAGHGGWLFDNLAVPLYLKNVLEDKNRQEDVITASDLEWTIVRPPMLSNNAPVGAYRVITDGDEVVTSIARADVAGFMLAQLDNRAYIHKTPRIGY